MTASSMPFTIREATPDDFPEIIDIRNPDASQPFTLEGFTERTQHYQQHSHCFRLWVLEDVSGRLTGTAMLFDMPLAVDELILHLAVAPDARQRGFGSALLTLAVDTACAQGARALNNQVRDVNPDVRAWAERRGFALDFYRFESVLDLTTFDETHHTDLQERLTSAGITFQDMGTLGHDEANWIRLSPFFADLSRDMPDVHGRPPMTVEQARQALREDPTVQPEGIVLATRGGDWLGMSVLMVDPRSPYNLFTGVRPEARGLGLARALKLEVIRRARAAGLKQLLTHNHSANVPMLAVNEHLGYERQGLWVMRRPLS